MRARIAVAARRRVVDVSATGLGVATVVGARVGVVAVQRFALASAVVATVIFRTRIAVIARCTRDFVL